MNRLLKTSLLTAVMAIFLAMIPIQLSARMPKKPNLKTTTSMSTSGAPDFAYPETVAADALRQLDSSLKSGHNALVVKSLIDYTLSLSLKDMNQTATAIAKIDSVIGVTSDPGLRAILNCLLNKIYVDYYTSDSFTFDQRELPLSPRDSDIDKWSGEQFKACIREYVDASLADADALKAIPLRDYATAIIADSNTYIYYPTLYDFVAYQAISSLTACSDLSNILPARLMVPFNVFATMKFNQSSPTARRILEIYASLTQLHLTDTPALINTDINRINFISSHIFDDSGKSKAIDLLKNLYMTHCESEYSGNVLVSLSDKIRFRYYDSKDKQADIQWTYNALKTNLAKFPSFSRNTCLENCINEFSEQSISMKLSDIIRPGVAMPINIDVENANIFTLEVYNLKNYDPVSRSNKWGKDLVKGLKPIATINKTVEGTVPFQTTVTVDYTFPEQGYYCVVAVLDGEKDYSNVIYANNLALLCANIDNNEELFVLDCIDGAGVKDASVIFSVSDKSKKENIGMTDSDGRVKLSTEKSGHLTASVKGGKFTKPLYFYNYRGRNKDWRIQSQVNTDLAVYHPGDTVRWSGVLYKTLRNDSRLLDNCTVKAEFYNANRQLVDSVSLVTDKWGRVESEFAIPEGDLTGNYRIALKYDDNTNSNTYITVSDYKLPTFKIDLRNAETDTPAKGDVTIRGNVKSYSGFSMAMTKVSLSLSVSLWGYFNGGASANDFYTAETMTDGNGDFKIIIPDSVINGSPCPDGIFTADVSATSPTGESHENSVRFTLKKKYQIVVAGFDSNVNASRPVKVDVRVTDYNNDTIATPIDYTVSNKNGFKFSRHLGADGLIMTDSIPSGEYQLCLTAPGNDNVEKYSTQIIVYRPTDKTSPCPDQFIWTPDMKFNLGSDRKLSWLFASNCNSTLNIIIIDDNDKEMLRKQIKVNEGMNIFDYTLPDDVKRASMTVFGVGNYKFYNNSFRITAPESRVKLMIKTESFRDRVVPSTEETWTFSVVDSDGNPQESAVIMDMYNSALDAIKSHGLELNAPTDYFPSIRLRFNDASDFYLSSYKSTFPKRCQSIREPRLNFYGKSVGDSGCEGVIVAGYATMRKSEYMRSAEMVDALQGQAAGINMTTESAADDVEEEAVKAISDEPVAAEPEFSYRDSETVLAFFRPMLNTDKDGHLSLTFTVPNANTTWRLNALAFTDKVKTAEFDATVLASKPVMVQPNLPRFIRTGDDAVVKALVMNNTDSAMTVNTVVEIFDPADGKTISATAFTDSIAANASATVAVNLSGSADMPFVGYRVKSSVKNFADGEQALIPVLPSTTPLIETRPFYIAPDSTQFSMVMPDYKGEARVTLQFCENPAWYVVTALPGLMKADPSTANDAAASIFSASIAQGLLRDNPAIEKALREWTDSEKSDSTLTSMLSRNADLKIMLLNATPWMMDARSDTERMTRLALLFDRNEINRVISAGTDLLHRLERSGGGWAWYGSSTDASEWSTTNVMLMMGRLLRLGYLPDDKALVKSLHSAMDYLDAEALKDYRKYPKSDFRLYTYMRSLFPSDYTISSSNKAIVSSTVNSILRNWKKDDVFNKAIDALILKRNGYPTAARPLIESLRQYADYAPEKGMWWPSLDNAVSFWSMDKLGTTSLVLEAFSEVVAGSADIDHIRQWMILQKEATDWGTSVTATQVVNSILATSKKWLQPARGVEVTIGGKQIVPSAVENVTGYFRTDVTSAATPGSTLKITRTGDSPAWGAVYGQFTSDMADVKEHSIADLSISKRLLRYVDSADGKSVTPAGEMSTGDRIRVELTITAGRDMDYVAVIDDRPACFEPVEQLPKPIFAEGIYFYRENRDSQTRIFVDHLPKGSYILTYDMWVNNAGDYTSGVATIQSQYAPQLTAHSAGEQIKVEK